MTDVEARQPGEPAVEELLEPYRRELTGYCYRMMGSSFEAEDAVQETMVRAWKAYDRFEGRSALRSWLYRIATNVCLDHLNGRNRRARPMDLGAEPVSRATSTGPALAEATWIEPMPTARLVSHDSDPGEAAVAKESVRLAFIGALQHLPPRQRAVLILREVLRWHADEVAALLGTTVASVNSALQRARATLDATQLSLDEAPEHIGEDDEELLARYLDAFQRYDMDALTELIREDATQSMPPFAIWMQGRDDVFDWWVGPGKGCRDSRLVPTSANGQPAFGQYKHDSETGTWRPWALQVLEVVDGRVADMIFFLDTARLFPMFGLPDVVEG